MENTVIYIYRMNLHKNLKTTAKSASSPDPLVDYIEVAIARFFGIDEKCINTLIFGPRPGLGAFFWPHA